MTNNTPTEPGWHYRDMPAPINCIVWVRSSVHFGTAEPVLKFQYQESGPSYIVKDDGLWRGPVPMPGDTPAESFSDTVSRMARILGMQAENDQRKACGYSMAYVEEDFLNEATP